MSINEHGIWMSKEETDKHVFDKSLSFAMINMFRFNSETTVDIGCGNGEYIKDFLKHGKNCIGYDGSPLTPEITDGICKVMDFSEIVDIGKFDLVVSLEVGEHIPREYEQNFIDNICNASKDHVVLSWAIEGQGGDGHFNERNNDYVKGEMLKRGFIYQKKESHKLRGESTVPWFENTIMVFEKTFEPVTAIFFSCKRLDILRETIRAFSDANTYPLREIIIVNDSGDPVIHEQLKKDYPDYALVLHPENVGLIRSIDLGYAHIKTEYFFHCEDDWRCNGKKGFIEKCMDIMIHRKDIEEVWIADMNNHVMKPEILRAENTEYKLAGTDGPWHGFSTACALKRMSDYKKVAPYADIPWEKTIWHRECAIGLKYWELGYRTAILLDDYASHMGSGRSEYLTGYEQNTIFDIGCHIGEWTNKNYSKIKRFICVEANPQIAEETKQRFKDLDNIEVLSLAVSNRDDEEIDLYLTMNKRDSVLSSCAKRWETNSRFRDFFYKIGIKVKTITIEKLIKIYGEPSHIKIDVEGYENVVLEGLKHKSGMISFEWGEEEKENVIENIDYLKGLGYEKFSFHEGDQYDYMPEEWVSYDVILIMVREILLPDRAYKWGMIFAK